MDDEALDLLIFFGDTFMQTVINVRGINKTDAGSSSAVVRQRWEAATLQELEDECKFQQSQFHPNGYGTTIRNVHQREDGIWTCQFHRWTSCD